MNNTTIKFGKVELDINQDSSPYVPNKCEIVNNEMELETLALGVKNGMACLEIGETGTGKTSLIRYLAYKTNNSFRRINLNGGTTNDELKGHYVVDDKSKGMRWINGVLVEAMLQGYWLVLDEINACLPEITFTLHSLLDDDGFIVLEEHEGEIIRPHKNFRVFATMNPSLEYAGTKDLNKALLSRFPIVLQNRYPSPTVEMAIIQSHVPQAKTKDVALMVRLAESVRQAKDNGSISFTLSPRELINWARLLQDGLTIQESAELAILNKCELVTDRKAIEDLFKIHFGKWQKNQLVPTDQLEKQLAEAQQQIELLKEQLKTK